MNNHPISCVCGLRYSPGLPEDEGYHSQCHDEYLNGPLLSQLQTLNSVDVIADYHLFVVDDGIPQRIRREFCRIVEVAHREIPDYSSSYDGSIPADSDVRLYILANGAHGIAMLLTALDENYWRLTFPQEGKIDLVDREICSKQRYKIACIWVAKNYRGRGIGPQLVHAVLSLLNCRISDVGWELPLSVDGTRLIQKLTPTQWWGRGDGLTLSQTLDCDGNLSLHR